MKPASAIFYMMLLSRIFENYNIERLTIALLVVECALFINTSLSLIIIMLRHSKLNLQSYLILLTNLLFNP